MSLLSVCQSLSAFIGIDRPTAVMASGEREHFQLAQVANEVGKQIAEAYTWQKLKKLNTMTGNGTKTAYDLPSDFGWQPVGQNFRSSNSFATVQYVWDHDQWLQMTLDNMNASLACTVLGDQVQFLPAPDDGQEIKHYYQSKFWVEDDVGDFQEGFLTDDDTFRLDEQLLRLGMLWKWKAYKGLAYAEQMADFGIELQKRIYYDRPRLGFAVGRTTSGYGSYSGGSIADSGGVLSDAFPYTLPMEL